MANKRSPSQNFNIGLLVLTLVLLLIIFVLAALVSNNVGALTIIAILALALIGIGVYKFAPIRNRAAEPGEQAHIAEEHYPNFSQSFTYQSNRPPEPQKTPLSYPATTERQEWITHIGEHSVFPHALKAFQAADRLIDTSQPLPVDLGLLVFRGDAGGAKPNIHRTLDIPHDAQFVQPYLQLHVPMPPPYSSVTGRIRFEILNPEQQSLFSHEQEYTLQEGLNLITPPARFRVDDVAQDRSWELRISVGDSVLARHWFKWGDPFKASEVAEGLDADGEVSEALRRLIIEQTLNPLSLDELLIDQKEDQQK